MVIDPPLQKMISLNPRSRGGSHLLLAHRHRQFIPPQPQEPCCRQTRPPPPFASSSRKEDPHLTSPVRLESAEQGRNQATVTSE
jgi:hypothetical protein